MQRVALKEGAVSLSRLAAGCMRLVRQSGGDPQAVLRFIETALDQGITTFDLADIYGGYDAEALFGQGLALAPGQRDRIEIVSKCGVAPISKRHPDRRALHIDSSGAYIQAAVERSLRDLGTDRLDLFLLHRPDPLMRADEVAETFVRLREAGKVRAFGVSNFAVGQFAHLQARLPFALVTNQVELSLLQAKGLQDGTVDQLRERDLAIMAWSPLAGGKLLDANNAASAAALPILKRIAGEQGVEPSAVAIAWVLAISPKLVAVLGSTDGARLGILAGSARLSLDREDWFELYGAAGYRFA